MQTPAELKEKLGGFYLSKVHAKCSELTYWEVRNIINGKSSNPKNFKIVEKAVKKAITAEESISSHQEAVNKEKAA